MQLRWLWTVVSLIGCVRGCGPWGLDDDDDNNAPEQPLTLENTPWTAELYPAAIVEAWLRFLSVNRASLLQPVYDQVLGQDFVAMLDRLCWRLALSEQVSHKDAVESALQRVDLSLDRMARDFALELKDSGELLQALKAPLQVLLGRAYPPRGYWPFSSNTPAVALPRDHKELLLMSVRVPVEYWVRIMVQLADPMLLVLDTARMLGASDFALFKRIYQLKLSLFIGRASRIVYRESTLLGMPLSQRAERRESTRAGLKLKELTGMSSGDSRVKAGTREIEQQSKDKKRPSTGKRTGSVVSSKKSSTKGLTERNSKEIPSDRDETSTTSSEENSISVKYVPDKRVIGVLKQRQEKLLNEVKNQLFGALGSFCDREALLVLTRDLTATTTVMDAYMALLVSLLGQTPKGIPLKRIHSSLYTLLLEGKLGEKEAVKRRYTQAKLVANKEAIYLLPVTLGSVWILCQMHVRPRAPSTLTIWAPVSVTRESRLTVGKLLVDSVGSFLGEGLTMLWEEFQLKASLQHANNNARMSSGLVMAVARALATGSAPYKMRCHQQGVLQAAIDLLSNRVE